MIKNCLIHQPIGLGDILFVQGIIKHLIDDGWTVHYPVHPFYYDLVSSYIKLDGLLWYKEGEGNYPLLNHYGREQGHKTDTEWYLPLTWADCYSRTKPMISKYFYANVPVGDWRKGLNIERNLERESYLIDKYKLDKDFIIVNKYYNMPELNKQRDISISSSFKIHEMSYAQDKSNGFTLFDWIGALEKAKEVHTVGTSVSYLVDKYCINNNIYCYERRLPGQDRTYHEEIHLVHRNPNWVYRD